MRMGMETVIRHPVTFGFRRLFLAVTPNETSFEKLEDVPNYVQDAVPYFITMVLLEWVILFLQGKPLPRLNDSFGSVSNGLLSLFHNLLFRGTELTAYIWMYKRFNMVELPWESPITWLLCLIGVDFAYYWVHRCGHEVNFMWAGHQVHHSSEDYNLSTALRQSIYHRYTNWFFYMPMALVIPPSVFLVHLQFNLLYQFWIHTETIDRLGPLEWILSTPSHHRVHHGRNPYCIDKNYGGVFIVWDRMFGTFEEEKRDEKVVYGLVHNIDTWEPLYAQLFHLVHVIKTAWTIEGFSNKLSVIFKGPGWSPGKPRLGLNEEIPQVDPNPKKYDSNLPLWNSMYIWVHFLLILGVWHTSLGIYKDQLTAWSMVRNVAFLTWSLSLFGAMYDKKNNVEVLEMIRCLLFVLWALFTSDIPLGRMFLWLYIPSTVLWIAVAFKQRAQTNRGKDKLQ